MVVNEMNREADRSLQILRVARAIYPESVGGGAIHVHSMSKRQAELGHEVTILTTDHGDRSLPRTERRDGYTIKRHRELTNIFGNSIAPEFVRSLRRHSDEYDIVHAHSHLSFLSNVAAVLSRVGKLPLVLTNHGFRSQTAPDWIQQLYLPTVGRFTFNSADMVLCYSNVERDKLREEGVQSPISVIHNGIDCSKFSPRPVNEKLQLLFVGRLRETKGPQMLMDLFERLAPEFPELKLKLVGDGPLYDTLRQRTMNSQFSDRISLVGEVTNDALPEIYTESSLLVLPTSREGVPRTILEAMACETPVVTTNLPQVIPVIDDGGRTVSRDLETFETAVRSLLDDTEQRQKIGQLARQHVLENYSWDETVRETTAKYFELVE